jgi:hypothetical protein
MALPFPDIPPQAVEIPRIKLGGMALGPFAIRWYALAYIAGILLGWRYAVGLVRNSKIWGGSRPSATPLQIDDMVLWITLGIILGGRIGYLLFYMLPLASGRETLAADPLEIFKLWHGGMSFHGGAIGVALALVFFARAQKLSLLSLADTAAPAVPIGLGFGRIANFINGELWGRVTNLPWGMVFCGRHIPTDVRELRRRTPAASPQPDLRGLSRGAGPLPDPAPGDAPVGLAAAARRDDRPLSDLLWDLPDRPGACAHAGRRTAEPAARPHRRHAAVGPDGGYRRRDDLARDASSPDGGGSGSSSDI